MHSIEHDPALAWEYAVLEQSMRRVIDAVARQVCPGCGRLCCRVHYCRETARNPWYAWVNATVECFAVPADWQTRRDVFGLGEHGCEIRAGRYVFCYSYNCPLILRWVEARGVDKEFQELSELLLPVNRLPGDRLLHELRRAEDLCEEDLAHIGSSVTAARERFEALEGVIQVAVEEPDGA